MPGAPDGAGAAAHWSWVKSLLSDILDLPEARRRSRLEEILRDDPALGLELRTLVQAAVADAEDLPALTRRLRSDAMRRGLPTPAIVGRHIGPWRVVEHRAQGGMGDVYRAEREDGHLTQTVAIKILRRGPGQDRALARFKREQQIIAKLDHPNLARLLDAGELDDGRPYLVMEYVDGEPIDRHADRMSLDLRARLLLFRQVCAVVGHAHGRGIVHRDLKSDNILIDGQGHVKVVDFGIAKDAVPDDVSTSAAYPMTMAYASPEQWKCEDVGPPSDVYSLGVTLYRLLTGTSPYRGVRQGDGYALGRAVCEQVPVAPSRMLAKPHRHATTRSGVTIGATDLDAVVMKALDKRADERYPDAASFGDDLFRCLEGIPVAARQGGMTYRVQRFVARHRAAFGAAVVANLILASALAFVLLQRAEIAREHHRAEIHLAKLHELARAVVFDIYERIAILPGSVNARSVLVDRALPYLERMQEQLQGDPQLQFDLAMAYRKAADSLGRPHSSNLGRTDDALVNYRRALNLFDSLPASASGDSRTLIEKILVLDAMSRLELDREQLISADALLERELSLAHILERDYPDDRAAQAAVAQAELARAHRYRFDAASGITLQATDAATRLVDHALAQNPDDPVALRLKMVTQSVRGNFYRDRNEPGDVALGIAAFEEGIRFAEHWVANPQSPARARRDLAVLQLTYGNLLCDASDVAAAVVVLKQAVERLKALSEADASDVNARETLASGRIMYAQALLDGETEKAIEQFRLGIRGIVDERGERPDTMMLRHNLGNAKLEMGKAMLRLHPSAGSIREACDNMRGGRALLDDPDPPPYLVPILRDADEALRGCEQTANVTPNG